MNFLAHIQITLKPSVLDPQGAAVTKALGALGFDEVREVRVGRYLETRLTASDVAAARQRVTAMCDALLANLIIERYEFSLAEEASAEEASAEEAS
jgi:phosphoribosylformylglycinamidine synthase PurS subunit